MITYQDYLKVSDREEDRIDFVHRVIMEHQSSKAYKAAQIGKDYLEHRNTTIMRYQKLLYTMSGQAVPDNFSANYKIPSNYFNRFVTQQVQYLLGNGVTWENEATEQKLGNDFDTQLQKLGRNALCMAQSFGFYNLDHVEVFDLLEYAPVYDEENGAMMLGVRFWQIDDSKPLRATFYEMDGYTNYIWDGGKGGILTDENGNEVGAKRAYKLKIRTSEADGTEIYDGENYPEFPIVPLWGNPAHQSELVGLREQIDAYDLIKSGFANDLDDASQIYWTIQNAGGMDDIDLVKFIEHMKTVKAAVVEDGGASAQSHTIEVPYNSREALLDRLEKDLYKDAMALNTEAISDGAITATQIRAAYEPLNSKTDQFEYCVIEFIQGLLSVAGIEDDPTFTRSTIINAKEELEMLLQGAQYLPEDYVTQKILTLLGDGDKADKILKQIEADDMERINGADSTEGQEPTNTPEEQ